MATGGGLSRGCIPAERAGGARRALSLRKNLDGGRVKKARICGAGCSPENFAGKTQQILHVGKHAGVAGCAAEHGGVFILDLALNAAAAEGCVLLGGRNEASRLGGRTKKFAL